MNRKEIPQYILTRISRAVEIQKKEGFSGIKKRIQEHFLQVHLIVLSLNSDAVAPPPRLEVVPQNSRKSGVSDRLEFLQVTIQDQNELEELTQIDEWKISKSESLSRLEDGWRCYVAINQGRIVASAWIRLGKNFYDDYLKREFVLGTDESYLWRVFTIPDYRGKGVQFGLLQHIVHNLINKDGVKNILVIVRGNNKAMIRTLTGIGFVTAGRLGFYELFQVRMQYMTGNTFKHTKKRCYVVYR